MNVQEALTLLRALCTTDEHFEAFGVIEANVANGFAEEETAPMVDPALAAEDVPAEDAPAEDAPAEDAPAEEVAPVEEAAPTEEAAPAEEETPAA